MNNLENLKKGDVINSNGKKKWFAKVLGVDSDDVFITPSYSDFSSALRANSVFQVSKIQDLEGYNYTIYTTEPEIKYFSNGAVRSGIKDGQRYYFINEIGNIRLSFFENNKYHRFRLNSKMIFIDEQLCETHEQEILDRQALEQKVWEIMDGKSEKEKESWFFLRVTEQDSEVYHYQVNGWCIDHNDEYDTNTPKITKKAGDYLLSNEVTDYQRALWIEDWELAREYKSKE